MKRAAVKVALILTWLALVGCGSSDQKQPLHCCMIDTMCAHCPSSYCDSTWTPYRGSHDEALCASFIDDSFNCSLGSGFDGPYYFATEAKAACLGK
jgi:hypothetical protein